MSGYWDPHIERMPLEDLHALQEDRLKSVVRYVYDHSAFYRQRFKEAGVEPGDIRTLGDVSKLPFTRKVDLRDNYPTGMFSAPKSQVVRYHVSSGTTGKPTVVGYTKGDIETWSESLARALTSIGLDSDDVVQVGYGYGLFTGGLGLHYGAELLGAAVIPVSGGNSKRQITILQDYGPSLLAATPSYALHLAEVGEEMGVDFARLPLRSAFLGAEPWTEAMRGEIERRLGLKAHNIYGLSEVIGPGVSFECECQDGAHINEDHFIPEVIAPDSGEVLPDGSAGELVFTCVTKECLPLVRYRTRDVCVLDRRPCPCGRTTTRMSLVTGRTDDMLIIRGVNVYPSQIEGVLLTFSEVEPHYLIVVDREGTLDELTVQVESAPSFVADRVGAVETLARRIGAAVESVLGLSLRVQLLEPKSLARSEGKAQRVRDNRRLG